MAIIPGITGQKAELFDGAKIDAISEYTAGNGVQLQGRTSSSAVSTGLVGEVLTGSILNPTLTSNVAYNAASLVLPAGHYMVYGKVGLNPPGSTKTLVVVSISGTSATENNKTALRNATTALDYDYTASLPYYVRTTGTTVYLTVRVGFSGTAPAVQSGSTDFYAIRIA